MDWTTHLIGAEDPRRRDPASVGGKGAALARLQAAGFAVPPWFALDGGTLRAALDGEPAFAALRGPLEELAAAADPAARLAVAARLRAAFEGLEPPAGLVAALRAALDEWLPGAARVSARSSAADEDGRGDSFAGIHDSFLFVSGAEALAQALLRVWASAFSERAVVYRAERGLAAAEPRMAVLVQDMVEAVASGIAFTANPSTGNVEEILVSSCWGAGEGIVSAGLDADLFTVSKRDGATEVRLAVKEEQLLRRASGDGLERAPVPPELRGVPSLAPATLRGLVEELTRLERLFRVPQDVEFSVDGAGRLFLLQARPVTTVAEAGPAAGNPIVWDNSNIVESYSGPTSPMTFSFIRHAYSIVYHCFARVMGVHPREVERHRHVFTNMLGLFRGRVYYNLHNWYRLVALFPGFRWNSGFMESMMGVKVKLPEDERPGAGAFERLFVELPRLLRLVWRSLGNFRRIDALVERFQRDFDGHMRRWQALDLDGMAPHELMALYREMEEALLWKWDTPIVNDFFVMVHYGLLKKACAGWCGDADGSLQNDLLCGQGDIESTAPTRRLMAIAREVRARPDRLAAFLAADPAELAAGIRGGGPLEPVHAQVRAWLDDYGFRCMDELKLEEPSLKERPLFVYQVLQNYLRADEGLLDPSRQDERERRVRGEAEARAATALSAGVSLLPRRWIFGRLLAAARKGVRNRENLRFARTRIYGLLRELLNAIGRDFEREGILDGAADLYLLTIDEVWDFIKGTAVTTDLRGLAELRRVESARWRDPAEPEPDDRFTTWGSACHRNLFRDWSAAAAAGAGDGLRGVGCSPGRVEGVARVVASPQDDLRLNGEILVAARTDPGWVPLYPAISGLVVERGSILSHSAIVAREMGIPTVVGVSGLMGAVRDGQRLRLDGSTGEVEPLEDGPAA